MVYIAILRGINVGQKNRIKMTDLRQSLKELGLAQIQTYIQSGNLVFVTEEMPNQELEKRIAVCIKKDFDSEVSVIAHTQKDWQKIMDENPFLQDSLKEEKYMHVSFLGETPADFKEKELRSKLRQEEGIEFGPQAVYRYCPNGYGKTKLTNSVLENKLKVKATTRNWRTTSKLLQLAKQTQKQLDQEN